MSLKKNIVASYANQIYVALVGIIVLPLYIRYMGAETYGLVGFFTMLQAWFALLDLGLTPTIARETACFLAGSYDALNYRRLFRALHLLFMVIAFAGGIALFNFSSYISLHWLNVKNLDLAEVTFAIEIMAIIVSLRWMTGIYRGVVTGSEKLVWLSGFNIIIASFRFLGVFPVFWHFGATPNVFFRYQLIVAILEFTGLWFKASQLLPELNAEEKKSIGYSIKPIKTVLEFALSIALTSGIWVIVTQTDKLLMSNLLTLEEFGYYTLSVLVASGIMTISSPISIALIPRMVILFTENKQEKLIAIYRKSTQAITLITCPVVIVLTVFADRILYVWTGDQQISKASSQTLTFYAMGYGLLAYSAFPGYLQYALGNLKLHIIGSLIYISTLLPLLFYTVKQYGMVGAGYAWLFINLLYFLIWPYIIHKQYAKGIHNVWLLYDIILPSIMSILVTFLSINLIQEGGRIFVLLQLCIITGIIIFITAINLFLLKKYV